MSLSDAAVLRYNCVVEDNLNAVWRVARRCGIHSNHLDDVIQEVFLVVAQKLVQIAPGTERAFAIAVTVRIAANWRRAQRRRPEDPVGWLEEIPGKETLVYEPAERHQGLMLLEQSLELMTEAQREVFILAELEQLTAPEIAAQLELDEAAVVSRLRRSREVFRRFCEKQRQLEMLGDASLQGVG